MIRRPFAPQAALLALEAAEESADTTDDDRVFAAQVLATLIPRLDEGFVRQHVRTFLCLVQRIPAVRRPRDLQKVLKPLLHDDPTLGRVVEELDAPSRAAWEELREQMRSRQRATTGAEAHRFHAQYIDIEVDTGIDVAHCKNQVVEAVDFHV